MFPELFKLGPVTVYTYGVVLAAAYLLGLFGVLQLHAPRASIREFVGLRATRLAFYPLAVALGFAVDKAENGRDAVAQIASKRFDAIVSDHVYIPIQGSIGYEAYRGYPAYGEVAAGVGLQSKYDRDDSFQFFGQLLAGTNPHGLIVKAGIGMNYGLSDHLAVYASAGTTVAVASNKTKTNFRSDNIGLGLTYRFSLPSW